MNDNSWLDDLDFEIIRFGYLRKGGDFDTRKNIEIKKCGICGMEFLPREDQSRLVCYSKVCIEKYDKAKLAIIREERKRVQCETKPQEQKNYQVHGYIYLMQSENGYYKIGVSSNIKKRLDGIRRQFPVSVEIIHYFASLNFRKIEKYLHNKYSSKRIEYEWFKLNNEDVAWIKSIEDFGLDNILEDTT